MIAQRVRKLLTASAWVVPAVIGGVVAVGVVVIANLVSNGDSSGFERHRTSPSAGASASSHPSPTAEATGPSSISLAADGLKMAQFGQPPDEVVAVLSKSLGNPDEDGIQPCENDEGVSSRWIRWADLSLRFSKTEFVGYIEGIHFPPGSPAHDFKTDKGLAPGDSVERLHEIYGDVPVRREPSQNGQAAVELFTVGDKLSGALEEDRGKKIVTSIFAGDLC